MKFKVLSISEGKSLPRELRGCKINEIVDLREKSVHGPMKICCDRKICCMIESDRIQLAVKVLPRSAFRTLPNGEEIRINNSSEIKISCDGAVVLLQPMEIPQPGSSGSSAEIDQIQAPQEGLASEKTLNEITVE
jgi:hypothetical protein